MEPAQISIKGEELRALLTAKKSSVEGCADALKISRQAVNKWITGNRIPPLRLSQIVKLYKVSVQEISSVVVRESFSVLFRTLRNVNVPNEIKSKVLQIAKDFVLLDRLYDPLIRNLSVTIKSQEPESLSAQIKQVLNLSNSSITLDQVILSLEKLGMSVIFFEFDSELRESAIRAFTVSDQNRKVIFIDSDLPYEDVLWALFHEVTHIFLGHSSDVTKEDERICNSVASEILTPKQFFTSNEKILRKLFEENPSQRHAVVVENISKNLGASFEGVVLAAIEHGIIPKKSPVVSYLYAIIRNKKKLSLRVSNLIRPTSEDPVKFWLDLFCDPSKDHLIKLQKLVMHGVLMNKVSTSRAAELLNLDSADLKMLITSWISKYGKAASY